MQSLVSCWFFNHFFLDQETLDITVGNKYIYVMDSMFVSPASTNFYIEALTCSVAVLRDGASEEVIQVK